MKSRRRIFLLAFILMLGLFGIGCGRQKVRQTTAPEPTPTQIQLQVTTETPTPTPEPGIDEDGVYDSAEDVALYIHTFDKLPQNFITKKEAKKLGWEGGSVEQVAPGKCIGGDWYGNYEGLLPEKEGREYHECDVDTLGKSKRGAKRIIYSNDGLIYYTENHYESFTLLYGEE